MADMQEHVPGMCSDASVMIYHIADVIRPDLDLDQDSLVIFQNS